MHNPDKFLSLLYLSSGGKAPEDVVANALCSPGNLTHDDYYLVAQMPLMELFSKTPEDLFEEIGEYTLSPEWKTTGRRIIQVGDIMCMGCQAYVSVAELDVMSEFRSMFIPLKHVTIKRDGKTYQVGVIKLKDNQILKDIICQSCKKT